MWRGWSIISFNRRRTYMEARPKPKRFRPPKPRTTPLKRGQACLNCRHLKTKCDGMRPVCGNCVRVPKDHPCTFSGPRRTKTRSDVRRKHGEDESENFASPSIWHGLRSPVDSNTNSSPDSICGYFSDTPGSDHSFSDLEFQEPQLGTVAVLLDYFVPHAECIGFFLHLDRFRHASLVPQPCFGLNIRPSPALLYAVYLWGAHLSPGGSMVGLSPEFLQRALHYLSASAPDGNARRVLQNIQAHVLLAHYFLLQKRLLPAQVHAKDAATLALAYQFHKLGSPPAFSSPTWWCPSAFEQTAFIPAQDFVEEGERVRCFWTVVSLQVGLNLALGSAGKSSSCILETAGSDITTPWPMQMVEYELTQAPDFSDALSRNRGERSDVAQRFVLEESAHNNSVPFPAAQAQATVLLHRALSLAEKWSPDLQPTDFSTYMTCYIHLESCIDALRETLPSLDAYTAASPGHVYAYAVIAAASVTANHPMFNVDPDARTKCLSAARAILRYLARLQPAGETHRNSSADAAVYVPMCALACRVLVDETQSARMLNFETANALRVVVSPFDEEDGNALHSDLRNGLLLLASYAIGSPLAEHYLREIQKEYNNLCETL